MNKKAGFFGLGIMGSRMAMNILQKGYDLTVYNRTGSKTDELTEAGAGEADSVSQLARESDILMTMLSDPEAIIENAFGDEGILNQMQAGSTWIDFSTVNPRFTEHIYDEARKKNIRFVDAPVAGTVRPAEKGELIIFAGGREEDLIDLTPIFNAVGKKTFYLGAPGKGTSMKMVVNLMLANAMASFAEAVHLGRSLGLDYETIAQVVVGGPVAAPFLSAKSEKISAGDYSTEFPLKHMLKDLFLATHEAYYHGVPLPQASTVREMYSLAVNQGLGEEDFSAIYQLLNEKA